MTYMDIERARIKEAEQIWRRMQLKKSLKKLAWAIFVAAVLGTTLFAVYADQTCITDTECGCTTDCLEAQ
jgi:hypothetical protein